MKTTLDLNADLIVRAKVLAARERKSLTAIIEEGLTLRLRGPSLKPRLAAPVPVSRCKGGLREGIDPCSNRSLEDAAGYGS